MPDGRQPKSNNNEAPKPTWTERAVPEVVKPGPPTRPFQADDVDALIPAADPIVQAAYGRTGTMPIRPVMNRGDGGTDALVIQKVAKQTRVLNFRVEGIHWRAGFAPEVGQTPLSQYVQDQIPPQREVTAGTGFVLRPVEAELEAVLRDIVPPALLKLEEDMFGRQRELGGAYLYFVPNANGAQAGMVAWYVVSPLTKAHLLYLQTDIKKADVRILDEMLKTFRASLVAREQNGGPTPRPLNFWEEIADAQTQIEVTIRNSAMVRGNVKQRMFQAREQAEDKLYRNLTGGFSRVGELAQTVFVRMPQLALAGTVRLFGRAAVSAIRAADRIVARRIEPENQDPL